jgi:hypothetical protein
LLDLKDAMQPAPPSPDTVGGREPRSLADVVERLLAEFDAQLHLAAIYAIVRQCRRELDVAPHPASPDVIERLARQRLQDLVRGGENTARVP